MAVYNTKDKCSQQYSRYENFAFSSELYILFVFYTIILKQRKIEVVSHNRRSARYKYTQSEIQYNNNLYNNLYNNNLHNNSYIFIIRISVWNHTQHVLVSRYGLQISLPLPLFANLLMHFLKL